MRTATINRKTAETSISLSLNLDGTGAFLIDTGCGFLDHMLTLFARHGGFDLTVTCEGDTDVDDHHTVEDIGISLGKALSEALGDKRGIRRYGDRILPMDESLILSAVDISGRCACFMDLQIPTEKIGTFDTQLCEEFFIALCQNGGLNLHIRQLAGRNSHHIIEGAFKSVARSLREAVSIDDRAPNAIPSTKGLLE
jgi:imidazoleglycerol-phosphate dehydratase